MDDGVPSLEVGFLIDTSNSFEELAQLQRAMDSTEGQLLQQAQSIERATGKMVNLGGATAAVSTFGAAATRELQAAANAQKAAEKSGEALSRQLDRQTSAFGRTREEMRAMKVAAAALAAEQQGLTDLASRLRAQEQALYDMEYAAMNRAKNEAAAIAEAKHQAALSAEAEAAAIREAAQAHAIFEAKVRQGVIAMREQDAVEKAMSREQATAQLRAEAVAAQELAAEHQRLAAAVRGSHEAQLADAVAAERMRAATDPLYAATKRLNAEIAESTRLYHAGVTGAGEYARQQEVLAGRAKLLGDTHDQVARSNGRVGQSLMQLSYQGNDIITMWMSGAGAGQIFATQAGQIVQVVQGAEGGFMGLARAVGVALLPFAPLIAAVAVAAAGVALFTRSISSGVDTTEMVNGLGLTRAEIKKLKDTTVGVGDVMTATFQVLAKNVGINLSGVKTFFGEAMDYLTTWGRRALAALYAEFVGTFRAIGAIVSGVFSGKGIGEILSDVGNAYTGAFDEADKAMIKFGQDVTKQVASNKLADLQKQAAAIKADRTPKADRHGEQLEREAKAIEAQIANLYKLAAAYGQSGAAALNAEARTKAETQAIKRRGDIEEAVERQVRLAIAQRVADAGKATAGMTEQAAAQEAINAQLAAGLIPAARASEILQNRLALLPLLAAQQAAQHVRDKQGYDAATAAIDAQVAAQERLDAAKVKAQLDAANAGADNQLEMLRAELNLIGATDAARAHELATIKAQQDAIAAGAKVGTAAYNDFIRKQVAVADATEEVRRAQAELNSDLRLASDLANSLGDSLAHAFRRGGSALGDMVRILGDYGERRKEIELSTAKDAEKKQRLDNLQLEGLIGLTSAAKGLFRENSTGYKAMEAAEKALTIVQLARTAVSVAAGAANMFATAGPAGFALVAAMLGVMASLGFRSGGSSAKPVYNDGKGTVFGDSSAESDSIKRSIDLLADIDTALLGVSRQMAASLKAIESNIGGLSRLVIRLGGVDGIGANAAVGVNTGFKQDILGKTLEEFTTRAIGGLGLGVAGFMIAGPLGALAGLAAGVIGDLAKKIPIIGDILGGVGTLIGSLFGSKTKIVGQGIFGGPQTLGSIEDIGFVGQSFADIKKTKKFFGVSTGSSYKTQFGDLDDQLETQFGQLLMSFADAIKLAAGPLGIGLDEIDAKLAGFVVDIGKIDLKDLTGDEIQEKLEAVFGAQADKMAQFAVAGLEQFQQVGEGYFETLIRVASTVDTVTTSLEMLGLSAQSLGTDASMAIAGFFDDAAVYQDAAGAYFEAFYTDAEQAAAKTAQLGKVFDAFGIVMPDTVANFRALVEAQDLTTAAGQQMYAALLQLAPAFAEIIGSGTSASSSSANAILRERNDLERQLMDIAGDTAGIRAAELAQLDPSNRALQERIYALQDEAAAAQVATQAAQELAAQQRAVAQERAGLERQMLELSGNTAALRELDLQNVDASNQDLLKHIWARQDAIAAEAAAQAAAAEAQRQAEQLAQQQQQAMEEAARAAKALADAWAQIGDTIMEEVKRIRGGMLTEAQSYEQLRAQFNAATDAARLGSQDAAKSLPELSRAMLAAAEATATDSLILKRIQDVTAASLEQTYGVIAAAMGLGGGAQTQDQLVQRFVDGVQASTSGPVTDTGSEIRALRAEVAQMRAENNSGHAKTADEANGSRKVLERAQAVSGDGSSISVKVAA